MGPTHKERTRLPVCTGSQTRKRRGAVLVMQASMTGGIAEAVRF